MKLSSIMRAYHFSIRRRMSVGLILFSFLVGSGLYYGMMAAGQAGLKDAISQADVFCEILSENAKYAQGPCNVDVPVDQRASDHELTLEVLYYIFKEAELFASEDIDEPHMLTERDEMPGTAYLIQMLLADTSDRSFLQLGHVATVELVAHIAKSLGNSGCAGTDIGGSNNAIEEILARGISGVSYYQKTPWEALAENNCKTEPLSYGFVFGENANAVEDNDLIAYVWALTKANSAGISASLNSEINQWSNPTIAQKPITLNAIETKHDVLGLNKGDAIEVKTQEQQDQVFDTARNFSSFLIGKIHSNEQVAQSRKLLVMGRGYEQWIMLCLLVYVLSIITLRFYYRRGLERQLDNVDGQIVGRLLKEIASPPAGIKLENACRARAKEYVDELLDKYRQEELTQNIIYKTCSLLSNKLSDSRTDDVEKLRSALALDAERFYNSRWVVRWIAVTIPAVGFVGTVRGILTSLSKADIIVWASTKSERAAAIGDISGELGLAFATTLIALLLGILISVFNEHQAKNESDFVFKLEEIATKFLDYRYRGGV